jgi:hypothetical protein
MVQGHLSALRLVGGAPGARVAGIFHPSIERPTTTPPASPQPMFSLGTAASAGVRLK